MATKFAIKRMNIMKTEGSLLAFADVQVGGKITIYGCRIVSGPNGVFVSTPQRKGKVKDSDEEKYFSIVRIDDEAMYKEFQEFVKDAYEKESSNGSKKKSAAPAREAGSDDDSF